jgi:TonB-linked SusC/RagA family outer membrane protein
MRKYLLLLVILFGATLFVNAQTRQVSGIVTDGESKLPLVGVTVETAKKTATAQTGTDGRFTITLPEGRQTLILTYVGYEVETINVPANSNSVTVSMDVREDAMGEVVVTALGIKRDKRSIGYSTSTVKGPELQLAGTTLNPALALYGKASGVGINIGSAGPTGGVNIRIRGAAGLESFAKTRPLFVVDGVPIYDQATSMANTTFDPLNSIDYGSGINDVNTDDIESIEILKGAKATVLYGSQALNGVVLITTKSGKKTKGLGINVSQQFTTERPFTFIDFQNEYGSGESIYDTATTLLPNGQRVKVLRNSRFSFGPKFDGRQVMRYDSVMVPYQAYPDNFIDFFRPGSSTRTNVAISGGGAFGSARASYSHVEFNDIIDRSRQQNNTFSFNGNFKVSDFAKFEFTSNVYSVNTRNRRPNLQQIVAWGLQRDYDYNSLRDFYLEEGYLRDFDGYALPTSALPPTSGGGLVALLFDQNRNTDLDKKFHTITSLRTTLQFTKQISFVGQAAIDYTNTDYTTENQIIRLLPQTTGGRFQWRKQNNMVQNYQALLNFEDDFMNHDLNLLAYAGWAYQQVNESNVFAGTGENGLRFPDWYSIGNDRLGAQDLAKVRGIVKGSDLIYGLLGSVTLSWKNTLYLQMDARNDWNSTLPPGNNSYFFPGASLVYTFTNHLKNIPKLRYGKLNLSWADVGGGPNVALQNRYFANNSYSVESIYEGASIIGVLPPTSLFLGDIKPFRKREFEIGTNTRWFDRDRVELELTFYSNNIYNQIIPLNINPATGYATANINSGNVKNWGFEMSIKASPLISDKYRWNVTFTGARQQSKIIKLYPGIKEQYIDGIGSAVKVLGKVGEPIGDIYMYDYARDPSGNRIVNSLGLYTLDATKDIKVGNINPKLFGGLYSDFMFKGFNFHIGIDYKYGGKLFSYSNQYLMGNGVIKASLPGRDAEHGGIAFTRAGLNRNDGIILPGVKRTDLGGGNFKYDPNDIIVDAATYYATYISDNNTGWPPDRVYKNDYIKLREISIDYSIPKRISDMLKLQKLSVNLAIRNLGYIYKSVPNIDPESALSAQGFVENSFYPSVRTFSFGVNVSF